MRTSVGMRHLSVVLGMAAFLSVSAAETEQPDKESKVDLHGSISQGFLYSSDNNYLNESSGGDAGFTELVFNASVRPGDNVFVGAQLFSRDLGNLGDFDPVIEWALVDWSPRDWLGMRAGKFKLAYGLYNETSDIDAVRTWVLQPQSVYNLQFRDFLLSTSGLELYGHAGMGRGGNLDYQVYGGRTSFESDGSIAQLTGDFLGPAYEVESISDSRTVGFKLVWETPLTGFRTGYTFSRFSDVDLVAGLTPLGETLGAPPLPPMRLDEFDLSVLSVEQVAGSWTSAVEYSLWRGDYLGTLINNERYYAQLARRLNDRFEVGGYYSVYNVDKGNRSGTGTPEPHRQYQKDLAASLRVDLNRFTLVKAEIHRIDGTALTLQSENPGGTEPDWWMFAAKVTLFF